MRHPCCGMKDVLLDEGRSLSRIHHYFNKYCCSYYCSYLLVHNTKNTKFTIRLKLSIQTEIL